MRVMKPNTDASPGWEGYRSWRIVDAGLSPRVVHCLTEAGVETIGELEDWSDERLLRLRHFGVTSLKNVQWFRRWAKRAGATDFLLRDFRALLQEFLNKSEILVLEQRYGLTDPLFRPQMRRRTLQEIANQMGGMTRERIRQIEEQALRLLRSDLCQQLLQPFVRYLGMRLQSKGGVILSTELGEWASEPLLGGCQPWGVMLLLTEISDGIRLRHDYFTNLAPELTGRIDDCALDHLRQAGGLVPFNHLRDRIAATLDDVLLPWDRVLAVVLNQHPDLSATNDGQYFLREIGAPILLNQILRQESHPLHFYDLTRIYNERVQFQSRIGSGQILRQLTQMPAVRRVNRGVYELSPA